MDRRKALTQLQRWGTLGLGWPLLASAQSSSGRSNTLVLGQSAAFSGPSSELGLQYHAGARLCFEQFNANGGLDGRKIELQKLDDGYDPDRCVANTRQFIQEGVFALFGYVGTATTAAALPLATEAKVPLFAPLTGAQSLREPYNRYVVHVRASYIDETAAIVKQLMGLGTKRVAVFHQNDGYGQAGLDGVRKAMAAHKLEPVAIGTVERNSTDVTHALNTILAANPEAVVQVSTYKASAVFV
ncbi:MAG TPA: ABC transporter substrate-binding protein, partial [Burkholderiaceae bacterium]|nr:ABC transporter substrate-binding protein [Burkholderiaceae bacterium]